MTTADYGKAFEEGFARTVRFLVSRGADAQIAEEAAQAAWTRGWIHRRQLRDPSCVGTWVNSIAMNVFRNSCRAAKRWRPLTESPTASQSVLAGVGADEILARCRRKDRALLELHYIYGYTSIEIGEESGLSSTAVRVRLWRARRACKRQMDGPLLEA